jgi:hypothetical protein
MPGLRKLAAAAVLMASPAPALAQGWCEALDRIQAAAREAQPFASLRRAEAEGAILVPGYRPDSCQVTVGSEIGCLRNLAPESLQMPAVEAAIRACLGTAPVADSPDPARNRGLVFETGGLRYEAFTHCNHHCRAGLIAWFRVTLTGGGQGTARPRQ